MRLKEKHTYPVCYIWIACVRVRHFSQVYTLNLSRPTGTHAHTDTRATRARDKNDDMVYVYVCMCMPNRLNMWHRHKIEHQRRRVEQYHFYTLVLVVALMVALSHFPYLLIIINRFKYVHENVCNILAQAT